MKVIDRICSVIDRFTEAVGKVLSFLVLGVLGVILCEVVLRRGFNRPQIWTQDIIIMLFACYIILICAYGFQQKAFVAVDVLFAHLPQMGQYIMHLITYIIFLVPFVVGLLPKSWTFFLKSYISGEKRYSVWAPPVWPVKLCLFIGLLLLTVQTVSELLKQVSGIVASAQGKALPGADLPTDGKETK